VGQKERHGVRPIVAPRVPVEPGGDCRVLLAADPQKQIVTAPAGSKGSVSGKGTDSAGVLVDIPSGFKVNGDLLSGTAKGRLCPDIAHVACGKEV
jgi:hypothetical protein